ncbi:phosphoribosylformylglycinamidine cyclo-ligase [Thermocrinis minervae]|uniref:Phosphoribosylformylglycinamidine cyclo-ligase n=1 Tax=Thermocrinis minervae TaxID=381751 RepID=A0A1M6RW12_9AQUI|nr:phosphoribosylformylglycinamidine cyclo-ligase [Thermocrinis minervae]SHK36644.1 phosphoribosylformylglycinamidine cyclo-ligase [Thermocrinis minervae]
MAEGWTYEKAGVSLQRADEFVEYIKKKAKDFSTLLFGSFSSGVELQGYKEPVIMMSCDGVGTKLKVAQSVGVHNTVGIDLVAMNVNDLITSGAKPIGFMDYIATGRIELDILKQVIDGIVEGCKRAETPLVGGETAEMPDFYPDGVYDLAGFCVGVCEKERLITGKDIKAGDIIVGLPSSGFHSNGYSLIRKILENKGVSYTDFVEDLNAKVWEILLIPTRIYWKEVKTLLEAGVIPKAMAHITGGGIGGNLIRVLPENKRAVVEKKRLPKKPEFEWIKDLGKVEEREMFRVFNMGVGFMFVLCPTVVDTVLSLLGDAFVCGYIEEGERDVVIA